MSGRRHIATLMRRIEGIQALAPPTGHEQARRATRCTRTCCASWPSSAPTRSGRWIRPTSRWRAASVPHRRGGRGQPPCSRAQGGDHAGSLHAREVIESVRPLGYAGDRQHRPGQPVHRHRVHQAVLGQGCKLSMDGRAAWRDNVFVERLWRSVKYERVYLQGLRRGERGKSRHRRRRPGTTSNRRALEPG
jgi:hypothetical protein